MRTSASHRRAAAGLAAVLLGAATVSACSSDAGSDKSSGPDLSTLSDEGQQRLEALYDGIGTPPAAEGPAPQAGKEVWFITAGMAVESVAIGAQGFEEAADALGWKATVVDGKFEPNRWLTGIEQAVAAGADGIVLYTIDCASVKNGLDAAKNAGIPVVGIESQDCDPSLMSVVPYADGDFAEWGKALGSDMALWLAASADDKATFIELHETDIEITRAASTGFNETMASECPDCEVVEVEFTATDIGPALQQKVEQALLKNPEAVGMAVPYDDLLVAGVSSAIVSSGRAAKMKVISVGGTTPALDIMRQGRGLDADLVIDTRWEGFAAADWMNRLLNGETPTVEDAPSGIGHQLVETDRGLPEEGKVPASVDFAAIYEESWGAGE